MNPVPPDHSAGMSVARPPGPSPRLVYGIVTAIALLIGGASWSFHLLLAQSAGPVGKSLPILGVVTGDLAAITSDGRPARFSELKGKVVASAYLFTKCPHGCSIVFGSMRALHERYGSHPDFHLASIAVLPEQDPPAFLKEFASGQGIAPKDSWTFYSGFAREAGWEFMHRNLQMEMTRETPLAERVSDCDFCEHDLRIALIDRRGRVRGLYPVMNTDAATRDLVAATLLEDAKRLLDDPSL